MKNFPGIENMIFLFEFIKFLLKKLHKKFIEIETFWKWKNSKKLTIKLNFKRLFILKKLPK